MTKPTKTSPRITRRTFMQGAAAAAAGAAWLGPGIVRGDGSDKLRVGVIGAGGRGFENLQIIAKHPDVAINAFCDVDQAMIDKTKQATGMKSREFRDFRKMFETHANTIDAVIISTPDHMHAPIAMLAMNMDKHVYCESPLSRTVHEARALGNAALGKFELALQMGTQRSAKPGKRAAVNVLRTSQLGTIKTAHAFTDAPSDWWKNGSDYGKGEDPVPDTLMWDNWLGVADKRPYQKGLYHPSAWRGCRDFGGGPIGTMGPHIIDTAFYGLGLVSPTSVTANAVEGGTDLKYPDKTTLTYVFPENSRTGGEFTLHWYEAGAKPSAKDLGIPADFDLKTNAIVFVGEKGTLYSHMDGEYKLFVDGKPQELEANNAAPAEYPHIHEWVDACLGFGECGASFPFAARLTETVLLGSTVASRLPGKTLEWDADAMKVTNHDAANAFLKRDPREGWAVEGL